MWSCIVFKATVASKLVFRWRRVRFLNLHSVVYRLACSCGAFYIWQFLGEIVENRIHVYRTLQCSSVCCSRPTRVTRLIFATPLSSAVKTIGDDCRFSNPYWFKNTSQSFIQAQRDAFMHRAGFSRRGAQCKT